jgi:hypothetical protein
MAEEDLEIEPYAHFTKRAELGSIGWWGSFHG